MGLIKLTSNNPKLSFVIKKNPATGMVLRKLRKGTVFGWYSKDQLETYNIFFEDSITETSYNSGDYEYLDTMRYVSALMIMNCLEELLGTVRRQQAPEDTEGFENSIFINSLQITNNKICKSFTTYFKGEYDTELTEIAHKCYKVTLSTKKSLHDLLNYTMFFCLMAAVANGERLDLDEQLTQKYINVINTIDAPLIKHRKSFLKFQSQLEASKRYESLHMCFGDTAKQRLSNLMSSLSFKFPIIDIGCNTGDNAVQLAKKLGGLPYYAVDVDESVLSKLQIKISEEDVTNITTFVGLDGLLESGMMESEKGKEEYDVLLTEVVEHMSIPEAEALVRRIIDSIHFNSLTITTPNQNFNKMRHHDHKWEMKAEEFNEWINKLIPEKKKAFFGTGCEVNNQFVTCGVTVTN